jgi:hypothetical protein
MSVEIKELVCSSTGEKVCKCTTPTWTTKESYEKNQKGLKYDDNKPRVELLSSVALLEIAKVLTFGAKKYATHNWRKGISWSIVLGAALRHLLAFLGGENKDQESGISHLAHAACCLMFLLEYETTHKEIDDRYKK